MAPGETENNAYAKFWSDKQRALWYVMVFSGVVNCVWSIFTFTLYLYNSLTRKLLSLSYLVYINM